MSGKREYQLEDGKLILDRVRPYFNVPLTSPPRNVTLLEKDALYTDIAAYFDAPLKQALCKIISISVLQNRMMWERYHSFKNLHQAKEQEERTALNLQDSFFETLFKDTVLFHGTQPDSVTSILDHGLDGRFSNSYDNCGPAIYLSPSFEKCDLFASRHNPSQRSLVVCVTALGKIHDNSLNPTVSHHTKYPPRGYHSVKHFVSVADEYVVYDNSQVLPILAITYEKIVHQNTINPFILPPFQVVSPFVNQGIRNNQPIGFSNSTYNFGPLAAFNIAPHSSTFFRQHISSLIKPSAQLESNWIIRKAQQMMHQWEVQADISQGLEQFYGTSMANQRFWPVTSGGLYPNLVSYLDLVMSKCRNGSSTNLDQGLINTLKSLNSFKGRICAQRQQVETNRSVNLQQILTMANQERIQEAISSQESCTICAEIILAFSQNKDLVIMNNCPHIFHKSCIETWLSMPSSQMVCPNCKTPCHDPMAPPPIGPMPDGDMAYIFSEKLGAWFICYWIPNGTQLPCHLSPGQPFKGTTRTAVCPIYFKWGPLLFIRLISAFYYHHTFTVGTSLTTNMSDTTTWNGIHHKTSLDGGFGFPDKTYEERVSLELDAKGVLLFLRDLVSD
ncbi:6043_t:CDS:2 [Diversispora eburnea]|uniref:RING-type E3 ubiquitin transferase n=2 Tax=Diversisporales TaxID=214509 RepID=A0A9N9FJF4_9GLOM|nr:6043_t:CDS:2 [Diversispora eburnea]